MIRSNDRVIKVKVESDLLSLTELINDWDPVGLISCGAPKDEYDCLTGQVLSALYKGCGTRELHSLIEYELSNHFGMGLEVIPDNYKQKYQEIMDNEISKIHEWYINKSCNKNEAILVRELVRKEIEKDVNFINYHGITRENVIRHLVEPFQVIMDPDDLENEPYMVWIVLQELLEPTHGYVIAYDFLNDHWSVAEHTADNCYIQVIGAESFYDALEGM